MTEIQDRAEDGDESECSRPGMALEITVPGWLVASLRGPRLFVYRSSLLRDDDPIYLPIRELIGGLLPNGRTVVRDPRMMFGEAEYCVYFVEHLPWATVSLPTEWNAADDKALSECLADQTV